MRQRRDCDRRLWAAVAATLLFLLALPLASCAGHPVALTGGNGEAVSSPENGEPQELLVSAAAGLKDAFTEIGVVFDAATGAKTTFNFSSAGMLGKQIEGGAPADLFASSDPELMERLREKTLIDPSSVRIFAHSELVLVIAARRPYLSRASRISLARR